MTTLTRRPKYASERTARGHHETRIPDRCFHRNASRRCARRLPAGDGARSAPADRGIYGRLVAQPSAATRATAAPRGTCLAGHAPAAGHRLERRAQIARACAARIALRTFYAIRQRTGWDRRPL